MKNNNSLDISSTWQDGRESSCFPANKLRVVSVPLKIMFVLLLAACTPIESPDLVSNQEIQNDYGDDTPVIDQGDNISLKIRVSADTHAEKSQPELNFGNSDSLRTRLIEKNNDLTRSAFLSFSIVDIPQEKLMGAKLHLYTRLSGGSALSAELDFYETNADWMETELSWSNKPMPTVFLGSKQFKPASPTMSEWFVMDVNKALQAAIDRRETHFSVSAVTADNVNVVIQSKESSNGVYAAYLELVGRAENEPVNSSGDDAEGNAGNSAGNGTEDSTDHIADTETDDTADNNTDNDVGDSTDNNTGNEVDDSTDNNSGTGTGDAADNSSSGMEQLVRGEALWTQKSCSNCHGDKGDGQPKGSSILTSVSDNSAIFEVVTTMPIGNAAACGQQCSEDIVAWLAFTNQLEVTVPDDSGSSSENPSDDNLPVVSTPQAQLQLLHKATLNLVSRVPSEGEMAKVKELGMAGLNQVISGLTDEEAFYDRVVEIYNFSITDNPFIYLYSYGKQFEGGGSRWYNNIANGQDQAKDYSDDSIGGDFNNLIRYVVKNNKPFTEILTAEYSVFNYYGARTYNQHAQHNWAKVKNPQYSAIPYDPKDLREIVLPIPQAGIFTTGAWQFKTPTTETNRGRHRSYKVFLDYLDVDLLSIPGSRADAADIAHANPTLTNDACTGCHKVMDPVASTFAHWSAGGVFSSSAKHWEYDTILPAGFNGDDMSVNSGYNPIQWMAQNVANDRRFAVATVKKLIKGFTGFELLSPAQVKLEPKLQSRYEYQIQLINSMVDEFVASGHDFKALVRAVVLGEFYTNSVATGGNSRAIPAPRLNRKLMSLLDVNWIKHGSHELATKIRMGALYQAQPNGMMSTMLDLASGIFSCKAVSKDLNKSQPTLLPHSDIQKQIFDVNGSPINVEHESIKKDLQQLYWHLWGQQVTLDNDELLTDYQSYLALLAKGQKALQDKSINQWLSSTCHNNVGVSTDPDYRVRAWMDMVNLMINDHRFIFE